MGVVYFSIIPTFEPSRYCKCWIVCFYYTFLENNHNVAFYSLSIGLEEYFETYHQVCVYLSEYERDDKEKIN